jgi:Putative auto-transporter adhesin, head GIN domain
MTMKTTARNLALLSLAFIAIAPAWGQEKSSNWSNFSFGWNSSMTNWGRNVTKGSDAVKTESRNVANFSRLELHVPADVALTQGASESLTITTDDNILPLIQTRVDGGVLKIEGDNNKGFSTKRGVKIQLAMKNVEGISIMGSGDIVADTLRTPQLDALISGSGDMKFKTLRADNLKLRINGSGDISADAVIAKIAESSVRGSGDIKVSSLKTDSMKISIDGSGDIAASGIADTLEARISGSGDIRARSLLARDVTVRISSSGGAEVNATETLKATVNGSGEVRYVGNPKNVTKTVNGSGSVSSM